MIGSQNIAFGVWILLGLCLTTIYKCNLKAMLTAQKLELPFNDLEGLITNENYFPRVHQGTFLIFLAEVFSFLLIYP